MALDTHLRVSEVILEASSIIWSGLTSTDVVSEPTISESEPIFRTRPGSSFNFTPTSDEDDKRR